MNIPVIVEDDNAIVPVVGSYDGYAGLPPELVVVSVPFAKGVVGAGAPITAYTVAHQLLTIIFHIIADGTLYQELGAAHYDVRNKDKVTHKLIQRLTRMGYYVTLQPIPSSVPIPPPDQSEPAASTATPPLPRRRGRPCQCAERQIVCTHGQKALNKSRIIPDQGQVPAT